MAPPPSPLTHPRLQALISTPAHLIPSALGPCHIISCELWSAMAPRGRIFLYLHLRRVRVCHPSTTHIFERDLDMCLQFPHPGSWGKGWWISSGDCRSMGFLKKILFLVHREDLFTHGRIIWLGRIDQEQCGELMEDNREIMETYRDVSCISLFAQHNIISQSDNG